jgi:mannose-6-phosphate isomerase-like protein (cupin superfamily)
MNPKNAPRRVDRVSDALDAALQMTFPASDPIAVHVPGRDSETKRQTSFEQRGDAMRGYVTNIESDTLANSDYRRVLYTGRHVQLVLMKLDPGEEIGLETHAGHDQFIRVESGTGIVILDGEERSLADGVAVIIPAGVEHNVVNTSNSVALRLYTLYGPPEHPQGTVHHSKRDEPAEQ